MAGIQGTDPLRIPAGISILNPGFGVTHVGKVLALQSWS